LNLPRRSGSFPDPARMLSAIIFDLDGTLVDTNAAHVESWVRAFARLGYKIPADRVGPEIGKGGDNLVPSVLGAEADGEGRRRAARGVQGGVPRARQERRFRIFDGVRELLDELRRRGSRPPSPRRRATSTSTPPSPPPARTCASTSTHGWARATSSTRSRYPDPVIAAVKKLGVSPPSARWSATRPTTRSPPSAPAS
jgi:beta-phosphoglucomutase-like phosphatase (HAD superfamily)